MANFKRPTTVDLINNGKYANAAANTIIETLGFTTKGDGGGGLWKKTGVTGLTASQTPAQRATGKLNDALGHEWQLIIDDRLNPLSLGVVNDAATDSRLAFIAALASGASVIDCTGLAIRVDIAATTTFTATNVEIVNGTFTIVAPDTSFYLVFSGSNLKLNGGIYALTVPVGGQVEFMRAAGDNCIMDGIDFDGGVFDNTGTASHLVYLIQANGSGTQENCRVVNSNIKNLSYVHLKSNSNTSTQRYWKFNHNRLRGLFVEGVGLNSPNGVVDDFEIIGNSFISHLGKDVGNYALYIAVATGNDIKVSGNSFYGYPDQCVHIEENSLRASITGNTAFVDGDFIGLLENNVGGGTTNPSDITITGNVASKDGTLKEADTIGIRVTNNASADSPANNLVITGNTMKGFGIGYQLDSEVGIGGLVSTNIADGCGVGFNAARPFDHIMGNSSVSCDTGVSTTSGSAPIYKDHHFSKCTALYSGRAILEDFSVELDEFAIGASSTVNTTLFSTTANMRINAVACHRVNRDAAGSNTSIKHTDLVFDGTTPTTTTLNTLEPGTVQGWVEESGGVYRLRVFSVGAGNIDAIVHFKGFVSDLT